MIKPLALPGYFTIPECQIILRYKTKVSTIRYVKRNKLEFIIVEQRILVKKDTFFDHLRSISINRDHTQYGGADQGRQSKNA